MIAVERIDHIVLTVRDIDATIEFYSRVLGMEPVTFEGDRRALHFGPHKINLHLAGAEFEPKAERPTPGSADLCLITAIRTAETLAHLEREGVAVEEGPVARTGALGALESVYFRDPDGNLIEVARYPDSDDPD